MRFSSKLLVAAAVISLLSMPAVAQMDYPNRENIRPLILPRGMLEIATGLSWLNTDHIFDVDGGSDSIGADMTEFTGKLELGLGVYEGVELRVGVPYIMRELDMDGSPAVEGFGDLEAALLLGIYRQTVDRPTSAVLGVRGIFPIGESEIGDEWELLLRPPARGAYAVGPFLYVREAYTSYLGFQYSFEWDFYFKGEQKFEGVTVDTDYGDVIKAGIEPIVQLSDYVALWFSIIYNKEFRSELEYQGATVATIYRTELVSMRPAIEIQAGRHVDIFFGTEWRIWGRYGFTGWPVWAELEVRF